MNRHADIYCFQRMTGRLSETSHGYRFCYHSDYLADGKAISLTLPLQEEPFEFDVFPAFFEGLLPEGWYLEIVLRTLKIDPADKFGLLVTTCEDCIGAVSVEKENDG